MRAASRGDWISRFGLGWCLQDGNSCAGVGDFRGRRPRGVVTFPAVVHEQETEFSAHSKEGGCLSFGTCL